MSGSHPPLYDKALPYSAVFPYNKINSKGLPTQEAKQMKKPVIASLTVIGCAAVAATFALGGAGKFGDVQVKADPTGHSFTFDVTTGSQFDNTTGGSQIVDVTTGASDSIHTVFQPVLISSLAFGQNGRFVEAHPNADAEAYYRLTIGINNLTHFEIDLGVVNDGGDSLEKDPYEIELRDAGYHIVKDWYDHFKLDGNENGTVHLEWNKGASDNTVFRVLENLYFNGDSAATNLYISSLSLTWEC